MLATLIPLFDENMSVSSYSLYSQKQNFLVNPMYTATGVLDGIGSINGLEIIENMGIETLAHNLDIFVPVNNISIFTDIREQCKAPHNRIVLLIDNTVEPTEEYVSRIKELKSYGYKIAVRNLKVTDFEPYKEIINKADFIYLDYQVIDITKATIYFTKVYPNVKLIAENIKSVEDFEKLKATGGYHFYEGEFYRLPITKSDVEVSPLKMNYIELLNLMNMPDYDLTAAADVIGRDTALVIDLLKIVNRMARNSEITSIRHAAAMMGQRELKRWITTSVTRQLCKDKPNEITRLSLLRARFAENLATQFGLDKFKQELFLMGLFSVIDIILNQTMEESLKLVKVSKDISDALVKKDGRFAPIIHFIEQYEEANWQEISRVLVVENIEMNDVYEAYTESLKWYRDLFFE